MMGTIAAWGALAMAATLAANAYFQFATGVSGWVYVGVAAILGLGAFRTLRKLSGGLRLLAGAWGLTAGVLSAPIVMSPLGSETALHDTYVVAPSPLAIAPVLIAFAGVALTVLHKEKK